MNTHDPAVFFQAEIRVGTIVSAVPFPEARKPAYKLTIDFGDAIGMKRSSAQLTHHYTVADLEGRQVVAVVNFPPKQVANFISECLVLAALDEANQAVLLTLEQKLPNGAPIA